MNKADSASGRIWRCCLLAVAGLLPWCPDAGAMPPAKVPVAVVEKLDAGKPQELIVLYDDSAVEAEVTRLRGERRVRHDDGVILAVRETRYRELKRRHDAGLAAGDAESVRDFSHLPMALKRFTSRAALQRFLAQPGVTAVYENRPIELHLVYSLPFIHQPTAASAGLTGSGGTVAVLDTGIDYSISSAFGACSVPIRPASGCGIVAYVDENGADILVKPTNVHGTNVAGIVAGVAPGAKIASVNVFPNGSGTDATVISGINWAIANKDAFNISAINMSLGDSGNYTSPCGDITTNTFFTPIDNARKAGIIPVASTGNNGYTGGISAPACTPGAVSVGAVYDRNWGAYLCDSTTAPDKIACFSNSASFMTILAPGAVISAAGIGMAGTSQAAPHVAGALAVLRTAFPGDSLDQSVNRLTAGGVPVTDPRNSITKPRLNLSFVTAAVPTVTTWPTAGAITYGQTLASATLTGGNASVPGSFAFTSPSTVPNAGTASQSVTFTPSDTTNYTTVTGSVSVTVNGSAAAPVPGFPLPVAGVTAILLCLILGARRRKGSPDVAAQRGV